ncbi:MAG TPA: hypothetical protein VN824_11320, partial [Puia sp.]|nr:hypothetical protein [Puia sp.]
VVKGAVTGVQLAGAVNVSREVRGVQAAGVVNYTRRLKGVQIGLINIADSSSGFMIGLVNIVKNGIHELTLSSDEITPLNLSYRTGSRTMYSILQVGFDPGSDVKVFAYGFGLGSELRLSSRLALNSEFLLSSLFVEHANNPPQVIRLQTLMRVRLGQRVSLFAGPAVSMTIPSKDTRLPDGYKKLNDKTWVGWTAGINIF